MMCPPGGFLWAQTDVHNCEHWDVQRAGRGYTMLQILYKSPDQVSLSHFLLIHTKGQMDETVSSPKTILLESALLWLTQGSPPSHWSQTQGDTSTALKGPQQQLGSTRDQGQDHHPMLGPFCWKRDHWSSSSFCDRWWLVLKAPGNLWWC